MNEHLQHGIAAVIGLGVLGGLAWLGSRLGNRTFAFSEIDPDVLAKFMKQYGLKASDLKKMAADQEKAETDSAAAARLKDSQAIQKVTAMINDCILNVITKEYIPGSVVGVKRGKDSYEIELILSGGAKLGPGTGPGASRAIGPRSTSPVSSFKFEIRKSHTVMGMANSPSDAAMRIYKTMKLGMTNLATVTADEKKKGTYNQNGNEFLGIKSDKFYLEGEVIYAANRTALMQGWNVRLIAKEGGSLGGLGFRR